VGDTDTARRPGGGVPGIRAFTEKASQLAEGGNGGGKKLRALICPRLEIEPQSPRESIRPRQKGKHGGDNLVHKPKAGPNYKKKGENGKILVYKNQLSLCARISGEWGKQCRATTIKAVSQEKGHQGHLTGSEKGETVTQKISPDVPSKKTQALVCLLSHPRIGGQKRD